MSLRKIEQSLRTDAAIQRNEDFLKVSHKTEQLSSVMLECRPTKLILPLREGEQIEHPSRIPEGRMYALTYPGTASSRCLVIYQEDVNVFIGGAPSFEYTQIMLRRVGQEDFQLIFNSTDHEYYFIPFEEDWKEAADRFKKELGLKGQQPFQGQPRYMLQMGVKRPNGDTYIRHFEELLPAVELFHQHFGEGHIVHLFGTNKDGYDRMFPDYTIDPAVGGEAALRKLLEEIRGYNLLTSHHYNPRLADTDWIRVNPDYKDAIVRRDGREVIEPYAGQYHYVMNLNHDRWYDRCMETVNYLSDLGFDYLEIDQFVYQRNFYDPHKPLALGYKRMVDDFIARGQKFWVEGLSDVFRFPAGNFCQILIRDRSQLWEDGENRRGYPYGHTYADFFMYLWPDTEVSYQIFTEHKLFERIEERFRKARHIHAAVYDIELGFFDESYIPNLKRLIETLERHGLR